MQLANSARFLFCLIFFTALFTSVRGWGDDGHQIVAQIAANFLTDTTQQKITPILNGNTLADIATWPDNYDHSSGGSWSERLHFVNLDVAAVAFTYEACLPPAQVPYGCVITAISNYTRILSENLQSGTSDECVPDGSSNVPCALSFLTHFVGDSHQPLHVAYTIDLGGNDYDCGYFGYCTELHSVWDSRLIYTYEDDNDIDWDGVASRITNYLSDTPLALSSFTNATNPKIWGDQSFGIARFAPYNTSPGTVPPASYWYKYYGDFNDTTSKAAKASAESSSSCSGPDLEYSYYQRTIPVVFDQLAKSGARLGYLLNSIYDPQFNGVLTRN